MEEDVSRTAEKFCPNCRGGNPPAASVCQWCGARLDGQYTPPPATYAGATATVPPKGRSKVLPVVLVLVVACVALAVVGSLVRTPAGPSASSIGRDNLSAQQQPGSAKSSSDQQPAVTAAASGRAGVGDTLESANVRVTVNSVRRTTGGQFFKPKAGYEYVVLDLTYENTGEREATVSSLISASLKDSTGQKYTLALGGTDKSAPDGSIAPGDRSRGEISFEVPEGAQGLVFTYDPVIGGDPVRFSIE